MKELDNDIRMCVTRLQPLKKSVSLHESHIVLGVDEGSDSMFVDASSNVKPCKNVVIHGRRIEIECHESFTCDSTIFEKIFHMKAFRDWCKHLDHEIVSTYQPTRILIQSVDLSGPRVRFIKFILEGTGKQNVVFMKGGSVAILVVLHCRETGKMSSLVTVQPCVPAGKYRFSEIPAGMLDASGDFIGVVASELIEKIGIRVKTTNTRDMIKAAGIDHEMFSGIYPSAGDCDEYLKFFLYSTVMYESEIEALNKKCTEVYDERGPINMKLVDFQDLAQQCPDVKTMTALYLYSRMSDRDRLPAEVMVPRGDFKTIYSFNDRVKINNTLIISTGDISDVDGFYALAEYAKCNADVMFIMNYPAYLDVKTENMNAGDGLGYVYNTARVLSAAVSNSHHLSFIEYNKILTKYDLKHDGTLIYTKMKHILTDIAFEMAKRVWTESNAKGHLYFCVGGINKINPFHYDILKNEILVYASHMSEMKKLESSRQGDVFFQDGRKIGISSGSIISHYSEIYIDFNGSMAFLDEGWIDDLESLCKNNKIKAVAAMGGVYSYKDPTTMPAIPNKLNRFSCSTMNQLYHPERTAVFFQIMKRYSIPVYLVANNAVSATDTFQDANKTIKTDIGWNKFLVNNLIQTTSLTAYSKAYYTDSPYNPPRKPFDFYTALIISNLITNPSFQMAFQHKKLFFDSNYGISLVRERDSSYEKTVQAYMKKCVTTPDDADNDFVRNKKNSFAKEQSILTSVDCENIDISVVEPKMNESSFELTLTW